MINLIKKLIPKIEKSETKSIHELMKEHEDKFTHKPLELTLDIKYNTQRDNKAFNKIPPSSQCGYTSIAIVLSAFLPNALNDEFISDMIVNFEKNFLDGKASRFAISMANHAKIYKHYIDKYDLKKDVVFIPSDGTLNDIITALKSGSPVEFSWMPTISGHFSTIVGYSEVKKSLIIHDPYGKFNFAKKSYTKEKGSYNIHTIDDITPYMNKSSANKKGFRLLYLKDK